MAWPPDVSDGQVILASHINAIKNSVITWQGSVDAGNNSLNGVSAINLDSAIYFGTTPGGFGVGGAIFRSPTRSPMAYLTYSGNDAMVLGSFVGAGNAMIWNMVNGLVTIGNAWNGAHFVLGASHLWVDGTGRLRIKGSAPTSETDGTVVGTQT